MCHFVLVFFSPFSIVITSLGEKSANLRAFRMFVRFVLVWICRFPLPFGVWEGLRFVIVAPPGLSSYLFFIPSFWHVLGTADGTADSSADDSKALSIWTSVSSYHQ